MNRRGFLGRAGASAAGLAVSGKGSSLGQAGAGASTGAGTDREYWVRHFGSTVQFARGLETLLVEPSRVLLEVGVLAQAGGMFVHMAVGRPRQWTIGNTMTTVGAGLMTAGLLILAYGIATA